MSEVDEIKNKIDIVEFISGYLKLKKSGRNFIANCPFHKEDTPSFVVSPEKQIWHCFGCQKGGDIFSFLMEYEHIDFAEALKQLANKAGVELQQIDPKKNKEKNELIEINEYASKLWQYILESKIGKDASQYLKKRGIKKTIMQDFEIGFSPDSWDLLSKKLIKKNFSQQNLQKSGLVYLKNNNQFLDRFRSRIMFPIRDTSGRLVGFSGRIFENQKLKTVDSAKTGKYINSPDTPIFNKSRVLYALDKAKRTIVEKDKIVIVEGQFDVIMAHQFGFKNTVAVSGSALTEEHLDLIKRFTQNIVFAFDPDSAGQNAARRSIDLAHLRDFSVELMILPENKDPADLFLDNPKQFKKILEKSLPAIEFYFISTKNKYQIGKKEISAQDKKQIAKELLIEIKKIVNPVLRSEYVKKLSQMINIDEKYLLEALEKSEEKILQQEIKNVQKDELNQRELLEKKILGIYFAFPETRIKISKEIKSSYFENFFNKEIADIIEKLYNKKADKNDIKKSLSEDLKKLIEQLSLAAEQEYKNIENFELEQEIEILLYSLKGREKEKIKKDFAQKISQAEKLGDKKELKKLLKKLSKQIQE